MTSAVICCDGAPLPADVDSVEVLEARTTGRVPSLNLRVEPMADAIAADVPPLASDLVRIAAYAYWADQMVSRGGETDVFGDRWSRDLYLSVPVASPEVWQQPAIVERLGDALGFASGDRWAFDFSLGTFPGKLTLEGDAAAIRNNPDCVVLFSGGADSCAAVIEAASAGRRPVLVSHAPAPFVGYRQDQLRRHLRALFGSWHFPHTRLLVNKAGVRERDSSQRSRAFLYAALGAAVASALDTGEVMLADNGVVSVNLPISGQVIGTKATRSTHPKFLWLFNLLLAELFPVGPRVHNPLWSRTKAEILGAYKDAGAEPILEETNSCAHARGLPRATPHCGVCSQCLDRRFASIAAGLAEYDPAERYVRDVFTQELSGTGLVMAESYVRTGRALAGLGDEDMLLTYSELGECSVGSHRDAESNVRKLCEMLRRQGETVVEVVDQQIVAHSSELAREILPASCLLRLAVGGQPEKERMAVEPFSPKLSEEDEAAFAKAGFKSRLPIVVTGELDGRNGNVVEVNGTRLSLGDVKFHLFLRLVVAVFEQDDGLVELGTAKHGGGLCAEGILQEHNLHQPIHRLRGSLRHALDELNPKSFIEVRRGKIRLSTHPAYVRYNISALTSHVDTAIRELAHRLPVRFVG